MKSIMILVAAALMTAGCASTPSPQAAKVRNGDPATINRDCKLLGTVEGRSFFGGSETARGDEAMNAARQKAAAMGATDIIFLDVDTSGMLNTGHAKARAYRC